MIDDMSRDTSPSTVQRRLDNAWTELGLLRHPYFCRRCFSRLLFASPECNIMIGFVRVVLQRLASERVLVHLRSLSVVVYIHERSTAARHDPAQSKGHYLWSSECHLKSSHVVTGQGTLRKAATHPCQHQDHATLPPQRQ